MLIAKKIVGIFSLIISVYLTLMMMMAKLPWDTLEPWYLAALILCLVGAGMVFLGVFSKNDNDEDGID